MGDVVHLRPMHDVVTGLRNIADDIESGKIDAQNCSLVIGSNIYHLGPGTDEQAASDIIFNLTFGIHKLMHAAVTGSEDA